MFDGIIYQQIDGAAMDSPLGPSLANAFLAHYEQVWLNDPPDEFQRVYYKRYVNDTCVLFRSPTHFEILNEYLNTKHANIKFTSEKVLLQQFIISLHLVEFTPVLIVL